MTNSKWYRFKMSLANKLAEFLPETVKRFVLYELHERAILKKAIDTDYWDVTYEEIYSELRD